MEKDNNWMCIASVPWVYVTFNLACCYEWHRFFRLISFLFFNRHDFPQCAVVLPSLSCAAPFMATDLLSSSILTPPSPSVHGQFLSNLSSFAFPSSCKFGFFKRVVSGHLGKYIQSFVHIFTEMHVYYK